MVGCGVCFNSAYRRIPNHSRQNYQKDGEKVKKCKCGATVESECTCQFKKDSPKKKTKGFVTLIRSAHGMDMADATSNAYHTAIGAALDIPGFKGNPALLGDIKAISTQVIRENPMAPSSKTWYEAVVVVAFPVEQ